MLDDLNSLAAIGVFSLSGLELICELEAIGHGSGPAAYTPATIGRGGQRRPDAAGGEGAEDTAGCGARRRQIDPAHPALDSALRDAPSPARLR